MTQVVETPTKQGKIKDLTGQRFSRWLVLHRSLTTNRFYNVLWTCRCDCGTIKHILSGNLLRGLSQSCGCLNKENHVKHNMYNSNEYRIYIGIKARCYNPNSKAYQNYGGRGIIMCDRWLNSFENFYNDMGPRPSNDHSIDRINNDGNYEPGNCRWITFKEQQNNKRTNIFHTFNNRKITTTQAAEMIGVSANCITKRINSGMTIEEAINLAPRRQERIFSHLGMEKNIAEWARYIGISDSLLRSRLLILKWPIEKALVK